MESRFDMTNFEQSLREQADQFTMIPSKKVWNGIYNSLHPGSMWPSISMLLFFLLALVGIGPLNNASSDINLNSRNNFNAYLAGNSEMTTQNTQKADQIFTIKQYIFSNHTPMNKQAGPAKVISMQTILQEKAWNLARNSHKGAISLGISQQNTLKYPTVDLITSLKKVPSQQLAFKTSEIINSANVEMRNLAISKAKGLTPGTSTTANPAFGDKLIGYELDFPVSYDPLLSSIINAGGKALVLIEPEMPEDSRETIGPGGIPAKESLQHKKKNARVTWLFYATPTISSVYFNGKSLKSKNLQSNNLSPIIINPNEVGNQMRYNARAGLNIGTEMNYSLSKGWQVISGLQLSYTGYNILSHKVHPSFAELVLREGDYGTVSKRYITYYGSGEGQDEITLHNNSVQLSLPVGASRSVWQNNNVEISISATVEPLLVLHANAYMLSADGRNYVNDPDLMRQSNVSGQIGSSISFSGEKVKWHIGPVIRYQVLSTFKNIYSVNEHLIDYGIRIGISR